MPNSLVEVPTWNVQDASKIQTYMGCPRRYFFEYVLGWTSDIPNVHLIFGSSWHLAMEVLLEEGYTNEAVAKGFQLLSAYYRQYFDATWDQNNAPKDPATALRALISYASCYQEDSFKTLHIEVAGSVAIAPKKVIFFKTDALCHGEEGYFSLEHKTGSRYSSSWAASWRQKMQVGTYTHVLYCLYPENEVYGVKINGVFLAKEPKLKKDGTPYAGSRDTEFHRIPVRRNLASMQSWLVEVNMWYDSIMNDFQRLSESSEDAPALNAFPRNTESCSHYGQCPFLDHCSIWHNPLRYAENPPEGYHIEHWDPREHENARENIVVS